MATGILEMLTTIVLNSDSLIFNLADKELQCQQPVLK
jgi:hypothetical protein